MTRLLKAFPQRAAQQADSQGLTCLVPDYFNGGSGIWASIAYIFAAIFIDKPLPKLCLRYNMPQSSLVRNGITPLSRRFCK
jgi:hypothetical protein